MSSGRTLKRMLTMPVMAVALATSLMAVGTAPATAAPAPAVAAVAQPAPDPEAMSATQWRDLKKDLRASSLGRTVDVAGGTRTLTYTLATGGILELREPVGPQPDVTTQVSAGGCGWFQLCVYFTPTEQRMILAGYGYLLGAAICAVTSPAGCVAAGFVIVVAATFLNDQICSYRLRVRVLPTVGGARCV